MQSSGSRLFFFPWGFLFGQSGSSVTSQFIEIGIIKNNQSVKEVVKHKVEGEIEKTDNNNKWPMM